jgi:hypothetical protein
LWICGVSPPSIHYNQSRHVHINQRHQFSSVLVVKEGALLHPNKVPFVPLRLNQHLQCYMQCFFSKKMFRGTLSLTQENLNITKHLCCQHTLHKT